MASPNESSLRDQIAQNLSRLEPGLELIRAEYPLDSRDGASGKIDILARDSVGHYVIIELKKSDATSRAALHELSKYIVLLQQQDGVARAEMRCILVSTTWHELLVPFSYFLSGADVSAEGQLLKIEPNGELSYEKVEPLPVQDLPTFSPEFDLFVYETPEERSEHIAHIVARASKLPFVSAAIVPLNLKDHSGVEPHPCRSIVCLWRIHERDFAAIEETCEFRIGHLEPYAFPGWEPECDVLYWLASDGTLLGFPGTCEQQRGTAEKVANILEEWVAEQTIGLGALAKGGPLNDAQRILNLLCAQHPRLPVGRRNPRQFRDEVISTHAKSWKATTEAFLEFIEDTPEWHDHAKSFIQSFEGQNVRLKIRALKKKHVFYALYQATAHAAASLSSFELAVSDSRGILIAGLGGWWSWDGTCPDNPVEAIEKVYGSVEWARLCLFSAVDTSTYSEGASLHGFHPVVARVDFDQEGRPSNAVLSQVAEGWTSFESNPLREFLTRHPAYGRSMAEIFQGIPTQPGDGSAWLSAGDGDFQPNQPDDPNAVNDLDADDAELASLLMRADTETNPQEKAVLWGMCIEYVLNLEDIQEGLTYEKIRTMNDAEAARLAERMQAVFEMREPWRNDAGSQAT